MTKEDALRKIKGLRDQINDEADCSAEAEGWENPLCEALDKAADILEFPKETPTYISGEPYNK